MIRNYPYFEVKVMTKAQIHKLITCLQHRKRMSQTIDDLESKIIAFLTVAQCHGKPVLIGGWEVFFDGQELSISETPIENTQQMNLFGEKNYEREDTGNPLNNPGSL